MKSEKTKILFLAPYPLGEAPSQRFRFEQYFAHFPPHMEYEFQSFWSKKGWEKLYVKGSFITKLAYLLLGFFRRFAVFFTIFRYHFIFIHRELTPVGPPVFEYIISRLFHKKVIYDFDDAIWLVNKSNVNRLATLIKYQKKVNSICKWSDKVSVGNGFLADFATQFNTNVLINPTVVDTDNYHNQTKVHSEKEKITIGWTGTHSTSIYLKNILPILDRLYNELSFQLNIISNSDPGWNRDYIHFVQWKKEEEIEQLLAFDIGIMPLENTKWEQGKCGFKIIQYLSLGIPAVASPVGANKDIIGHSQNGYLVNSEKEWIKYLKELMLNASERNEFGRMGRKKIVDNYSTRANRDLFFSLFAR